MPPDNCHLPRPVPQVMVSSTFTDLVEHRRALIKSLNEHDLRPNVMEYDSAKTAGELGRHRVPARHRPGNQDSLP